MSKEEQIKQLERDFADASHKNHLEFYDFIRYYGKPILPYHEDIATKLYNAGYRKQSEGEWIEERYIDDKRSDFKCSVCEYDDTFYRNLVNRFYKFCPNCGAKMKGGAE